MGGDDSFSSMAYQTAKSLIRNRRMRYISTRGEAPVLNFEDAMLTGLARDGGLYLPAEIPEFSADDIKALAGLPYEDAALRVMRPFIGDAFPEADLAELIRSAYAGFAHDARAPVKQIGPNHFLCELFHGPTLAFKDFAMQFIGRLFQAVLARRGERITIAAATSGDTGAAAVEAFRDLENIDLFVLLPKGRVSEVQRRQMTTPEAPNVHALALDGDFDDCQARLKEMFNDHAFRDRVRLAGVNSINWARVLAQTVYFFTAASALGAPRRSVRFCVPTGNFGDIFAGYIAKRMGLPIERLVIATNQNDILHRTIQTGRHAKEGVKPSISPSMDIQVSSNFERALYYAYSGDSAVIRQQMLALQTEGGFTVSQGAIEALRQVYSSGRAGEDEARAAMRKVYNAANGEIICPHTACAAPVANAHGSAEIPMITLATAHPAKFPDAVEDATGIRPTLPKRMAKLYDRAERVAEVPNDLAALQDLIQERVRT